MENNNLNQQNEQVTEPIVTEPVLTEPVVTEAVVAEPVAEPVAEEAAVVAEPVVEEPVVEEPVVAKPAAAAPVVYAQQPVQQQGQVAKPSRGKGLAFSIVSLALSLFGFIFALITFFMTFTVFAASSYGLDVEAIAATLAIVIIYGLFVIGFSIPALILGSKGKKLIGSKMGTAGVVFSIINFVLIALSVVMTIIMIGMTA